MKNYPQQNNKAVQKIADVTAAIVVLIISAAFIALLLGLFIWAAIWLGTHLPR